VEDACLGLVGVRVGEREPGRLARLEHALRHRIVGDEKALAELERHTLGDVEGDDDQNVADNA
jgi:hypothetical protein